MIETFNALRETNFWDKAPQAIGLSRPQYLLPFSKHLGNTLIKVLVGQRRCGKSYILRQLIKLLLEQKKVPKKNIFYLNKELLQFDSIRTSMDLRQLIAYY